MSEKNEQRKMTEFLTEPEPVSVTHYLHTHPYQDGSEYLQALRTACQLNSTLDEVKTLVEKKRQEMEKFDRQEKLLRLSPGNLRRFCEAWLREVRNRPEDQRAGLLAPLREHLLPHIPDLTINDLEWYIKGPLTNETRVIHLPTEPLPLLFRDGRGEACKFAILICDDSSQLIQTAFTFVTMLRNLRCTADIKRTPDVSEGVLNVMIGAASPEWENYPVKLYTTDLILDATKTMNFEIENISQYEV